MQVERHTNFQRRRGFRPMADGTWTVTALLKLMGMPAAKLDGGGAVAIVEYGGGWYESDVQTAAQKNGYPAPTITDVSAGGSNSPGGDADTEVALDIQNVAEAYSVLTGKPATIYMIWADSDENALAAIASLIDSGKPIKAVSISWGSDEGDMGQNAVETTGVAYQNFYQKYQIPVFVSSGDNDDGSGSTVDFPANLPWCVGCSGTTTGATSTTVWNNGGGEGTGGGESLYIVKPDFQKGVIPDTSSMRTTGDVASNADPNTGFPVLVNGSWGVIGGTSASSPLFGGIFGAFNLPPQDILTNLYKAKSAFTPVTVGNNNPNGTGNWPGDIACGLGVPNVGALYTALAGTVSPPPVGPPTGPPPPPTQPPPPPPTPPTTAILTGTATGTLEAIGPLHPAQPISLTLSGTVSIPSSPIVAPSFPSPEYCANITGKRRPRSISITQWLQIITAILTIVQQILSGLPTGSPPPTAQTIASQVANHPTILKYKPGALSGSQWLQLILEILLEILPILVGTGA